MAEDLSYEGNTKIKAIDEPSDRRGRRKKGALDEWNSGNGKRRIKVKQ